MKDKLKIFITWLLLSLLFFNIGLGFFIFEFSVQLNKNIIENFLSQSDEEKLLLLKITDATSLIRNGKHEIVFEGKQYDVKREFMNNGALYIYCIHDEKEERLVGSWNVTFSNNYYPQGDKQNSHSFNIIKHLIKIYFHRDLVFDNPASINVDKTFVSNEDISIHNYLSVVTPPPES